MLGNRYAVDAFEGVVPDAFQSEVDLIARSGIIGVVRRRNAKMKDPTRVKILGYVCDRNHEVINTRGYSLIQPTLCRKKDDRAKLILIVGTSMNSGKSAGAAACCWALNTMGYT